MDRKYRRLGIIFCLSILIVICNFEAVKCEAKTTKDFVISKGTLLKYNGTEKEIRIPDTVNTIGKRAFYNNQTITSVIIPQNVKKIEKAAFYNCKRLKSITLTKGIQTIGEEAFYHCISIQEVEFPKTVKTIGDSAFEKCKKLSNLMFPDKRISFGECVFSGIKKGNGGEFGEYVVANKNTLIQYIESAVQQEIEIPDTIRAIQTEAFSLSGEIYKISIPGSVSTIQQGIFGTTDVQEIIIKEGTKELEDYAFEDCDNLEQITIPSSVDVIGKNLFPAKNKSTLSIHCEKNSPIYYYAKKNGYNVEIIKGNFSVSGKTNTVRKKNIKKASAFQVLDGTLVKYTGKQSNIVIPEGIKTIKKQAFAENKYLQEIVLPDSIEELEDEVFKGCTNLEEVRLPSNLKKMGKACFKDCSNLYSISWPVRISNIPDYTFMRSGLAQFDFSGIERIGKGAFLSTNLEKVDLTDSIEFVEENAFAYCVNLKEICLSGNLKEIPENFCPNTRITNINIPSSVRKIRNMAFASCNYLTFVTGGEQVEEIRQMAFYDTAFLDKTGQSILLGHVYVKNGGQEEKINIPEGISMIYDEAFKDNQKISQVKMASSVRIIGDGAFLNCKRLKVLELNNGVQSIGEEAFRHCISIEDISFPDSITNIKSYAFAECRSLSRYTFPESDILFGNDVFYGVEQGNAGEFNEFIVANHNTLIAYVDSAREKEIRIPDGVEKIGKNVFQTYHTIGTLYIPGTVKTIEIGSFEYPEITNIVLEAGVKEIKNLAFYHCVTDTITIPDSVKHIESLIVWKQNKKDITIVCKKNSVAYQYAKRNNITIQLQLY